ncbi:uncharacterized protein LOC133330808, partial [Musca vetustissima]|uniref:uncharacterized protein LOC133330808 n=1 Tax=Musca vetustissima TaxID=27455 RepID=UPI002AB60943
MAASASPSASSYPLMRAATANATFPHASAGGGSLGSGDSNSSLSCCASNNSSKQNLNNSSLTLPASPVPSADYNNSTITNTTPSMACFSPNSTTTTTSSSYNTANAMPAFMPSCSNPNKQCVFNLTNSPPITPEPYPYRKSLSFSTPISTTTTRPKITRNSSRHSLGNYAVTPASMTASNTGHHHHPRRSSLWPEALMINTRNFATKDTERRTSNLT